MVKINVRSPYNINISETDLTSASIDIYIYTGTQGVDRAGNLKYTLNSTAYNEEVTFEISELVRDYLDITFDGSYTSQMVWVDYQITKVILTTPTILNFVELLGWDGYGYFNEGANPQNTSELLQSNELIYRAAGETLRLPMEADAVKTIKFYYNSIEVDSSITSPSSGSSGRIKYVESTEINIDEIIVTNSAVITNINVTTVEECKHTPHKLTFVNKFGVLQDLWFFKRANLSIDTSKNEYKGNILNSGTYSTSEHQNKILNKQGQEKLVLNSGFVDEQYNDVFLQLMLSEKVWVLIDGQTLPVNVSSVALPFKDRLNDKLINYTINIDFAFDKINSVRQ
jgi:hypothetical protein